MKSRRSLRRRLVQAGRELRDQARRAAAGGIHLNVAGRHNVVVAASVGDPGGTQAASSFQTVRIRQGDGERIVTERGVSSS